jgi:hypothetical protein
MPKDYKVWGHAVFFKDRKHFLCSELAQAIFGRIQEQVARAGLLLDEHFTMDGTLIEAWASLKSFRPQDTPPSGGGSGRNPEMDFHGERRLNQTHTSTTEPGDPAFPQGQRHGIRIPPDNGAETGTSEDAANIFFGIGQGMDPRQHLGGLFSQAGNEPFMVLGQTIQEAISLPSVGFDHHFFTKTLTYQGLNVLQ